MAKFVILAIILVACTVSRSERVPGRRDSWSWKVLDRGERSAESADRAIREIFQRISSGTSSEKDDEELVNLVKNEITQTANKIKTPTGSVEIAARRAQKLVSELTAAYTGAIYKSKSTEEARANFNRFQHVVQEIVDFIKNAQFVG
ncbi:hypothetical protein KM043_002726 [Ampulex compressa]|nr:hypothetical protein KM043_002726 [Ampulex compressa]